MKHIKSSWLAILCMSTTACMFFKQETNEPVVHHLKAYQHDQIVLENLYTREIAYCKKTAEFSAEACASELEKKGFVKLTDIPKVTAADDFLGTGAYPTRRWRENDKVPRW